MNAVHSSAVDATLLVDRFRGPAIGLASAARMGQFGLPHAMHGELVDAGSADQLAARAVDVVTAVLGPCQGDVVAAGSDAAWTLTIRWRRGVVVTLLVGRGDGVVHRYRVLGSNGQAYADLTGPAFELVGTTSTRVGFGPTPEDRAGSGTTDLAEVERVIAAARRSLESGQAEPSVS